VIDPHEISKHWHSIILTGRDSSTYKMALARCLAELVEEGRTTISWDELASAFLDLYVARVERGKPQLSDLKGQAVAERVALAYRRGEFTRDSAVQEIRAKAFRDVLDAFHVVDGTPVPVRFFTTDAAGLTVTEETRRLMTREGTVHILAEIEQRWGELEERWERRTARCATSRDR